MPEQRNESSAARGRVSEVCHVCGALQGVCHCPGGPTNPPAASTDLLQLAAWVMVLSLAAAAVIGLVLFVVGIT
jgi:hypothetical protein